LKKEKEKEDEIKASKEDNNENAPGKGVPKNKKEVKEEEPKAFKQPIIAVEDKPGNENVDPEVLK